MMTKSQYDNEMSDSLPNYLICELGDLKRIQYPNDVKVKYTAIDVSAHYFVLGCNNGTIFIFSRFGIKAQSRLPFIELQLNEQNTIDLIDIADDEKYILAASRRGICHILSVCTTQHGVTVHATHSTNIHLGSKLTALFNDADVKLFYAGDENGRVSAIKMENFIFRTKADMLFKAESEIIQFDVQGQQLLVSTTSKSYIYNRDSAEIVTLGHVSGPGRHGAIYFHQLGDTILCARGSAKLWQCSWTTGKVYALQVYNKNTWPQMPLISTSEDLVPSRLDDGDTIMFGKLAKIDIDGVECLVTQHQSKLHLIDVLRSKIILTCHTRRPIESICIDRHDIFVLTTKGDIHKYTVQPYVDSVRILMTNNAYQPALRLCALYPSDKKIPWPPDLLIDLLQNVQSMSASILSLADNESISTVRKLLYNAQAQHIFKQRLIRENSSRRHSFSKEEFKKQEDIIRRKRSKSLDVTFVKRVALTRSAIENKSNISIPPIDNSLKTLLSGNATTEPIQLNTHDAEWLKHIDNINDYLTELKTQPLEALPETPAVQHKCIHSTKSNKKRRTRAQNVDALNNSLDDTTIDWTPSSNNNGATNCSTLCPNCQLPKAWLFTALFDACADNSLPNKRKDFLEILRTGRRCCVPCKRLLTLPEMSTVLESNVTVKSTSVPSAALIDRVFAASTSKTAEPTESHQQDEKIIIDADDNRMPKSAIVRLMCRLLGEEESLRIIREFGPQNMSDTDWSDIIQTFSNADKTWITDMQLAEAIICDLHDDNISFRSVNKTTRKCLSAAIRLSLTCPSCTLPIRTRLVSKTASNDGTALFVLPCGHVYHKVCLRPSDKSTAKVQCTICVISNKCDKISAPI